MKILDEIVFQKRNEIKKIKRDYTLTRFSDSPFFEKPGRSLSNVLRAKHFSIIAEVKKASPSKGIIRIDFNHKKIAEEYINNGASAISVLTDEKFFKGSINFLKDIAQLSPLPLLRKDFILDEYQIFEAKSNGADAILLISEILSETQIQELTFAAQEIDLDVLLEMHSESQIGKIDFNTNKIIGINNRDLSSFNVDLNTTKKLKELLPGDIITVSESGISKKEDIDFLNELNIDAVLIGEHFMRQKYPGKSLNELKTWCENED